jgi:hypothetical protein
MDKRSLKLLSCLIVNEAKITDERKIKLVESIKNADEKELINFLKLNEELLHEIRPKTKTLMSTSAAIGYQAPIWALYRKIRSKTDACTKKCGTYELNTVRRQVCMLRCKISETELMIGALKNNPKEAARVRSLKNKVEKLKTNLHEYEARAKARDTEY